MAYKNSRKSNDYRLYVYDKKNLNEPIGYYQTNRKYEINSDWRHNRLLNGYLFYQTNYNPQDLVFVPKKYKKNRKK